MKLGKHLFLIAILPLAIMSCKTQQYQTGFNPYRDGGSAPNSLTPEENGSQGGRTAADVLRNVDVGDDFYRTEEEMWEEHEENQRRVERKYRRQARMMRRPQYSNPEYYGHRRRPRIRPVGKRKYCDECGIVH